MSKKAVKFPSDYGPVNITLTECDNVECRTLVQEDYMVGWLELRPQGESMSTLSGGILEDMDFCSAACVQSTLTRRTG